MNPVQLLTFTTLFPNNELPHHGIFVENRLRHLVASGEATATVLAPVPFFPSGASLFGAWARYARVSRSEERHGIPVHHPRYAVLPRVGMSVAPALLYRSAVRAVQRLMARGLTFDAIDAHYLYPDGVAAVRLGARFGKPVVITARGSDVTQIARLAGPRPAIVAALKQADALIAVSQALKDGLVALGAAPERVTVLRNGVDTQMFRPMNRELARAEFGVTRPMLVSVGHLIERKRHHLTVAAMKLLPDCELVIAGEGPEHGRLEALANRLKVGDRVRLIGARQHTRLLDLYSAANVMILASSREGWANVLLESMACGTPVVAMRVGGNAEVIQQRAAGLIAEAETPEAIAAAVRDLLATPPSRDATRAYASAFSWDDTTAGQLAVFREVLARRAAPDVLLSAA